MNNNTLLREYFLITKLSSPVGWGCRIHRLLLRSGVRRPSPNECPAYDSRNFYGNSPVMLKLWGIRSTPSLPSLPGPLWPGVLAPDRVLSMGQIEVFGIQIVYFNVYTERKQITYAKLNWLEYNSLIIWLCVNKWLMFYWIVIVK